jgi:hypothetical protein
MRIDEFKHALGTIADDLGEIDQVDFLGEVDRKVSHARRVRAVGAGGGLVAAVTVGALVLAPGLLGGGQGDVPPAEQPTAEGFATDLPTVVDNGVAFYETPAGDRLVGHAVSEPGEVRVRFEFTPQTADLSYAFTCWGPGADRELFVELAVNGQGLTSTSCAPAMEEQPLLNTPNTFGTPAENAASWQQRAGVQPGESVTVEAAILPPYRDKPAAEQLRIAVGFYENSADVIVRDDLTVERQTVFDGHTYQLVDTALGEMSGRRLELTASLAGVDGRAWALLGLTGDVRGRVDWRLNGDGEAVGGGGPWQTGKLLSDTAADVARLHFTSPQDQDAVGHLLVYERID